MIKIKLNGEEKDLHEMTIYNLLLDLKIDPSAIVVEQNMNIVSKESFMSTDINNGDTIELIRFVGGG